MVTRVAHVAGGKMGLFEKPTSGDPLAPFDDPGSYLDKVQFHTDLDFYRVHLGPTDVTVTLPTIAGATRTFNANPDLSIKGQVVTSDILLLAHTLPYVPNYQIIWNNTELIDGDLVQLIDDAAGMRGRYLSHWADTTGIYISSRGVSSSSSVPSMSFSCKVTIFKEGASSGNVDFDFDSVTGRLRMGRGMFDSDEVLLRAQGQAGDSPYDIQTGRSMDVNDGRSRVARADGSVADETGYGGSFTAPAGFQGVIS